MLAVGGPGVASRAESPFERVRAAADGLLAVGLLEELAE
jgi:hypothetical protein